MKKIPVILDCDNTFGLYDCDVDDGLALLYLLGCEEVELLGITCSFGNSTQERVYPNTLRLLKDWNRQDIPVFRGAENSSLRRSDASHFLAETAQKYPGELKILCTGSTGNLLGANEENPQFFSQIKELSMMGGLTEDLFVGGKPMNELNFSCDSQATFEVLSNVSNISIACAKHCLDSYFKESELLSKLDNNPSPLSDYLKDQLRYWYNIHRNHWNLDGIVNWDVMAAVWLVHPEYFDLNQTVITPTEKSLRKGCLMGEGPEITVKLPKIKDVQSYIDHVYDRYFSARVFPQGLI